MDDDDFVKRCANISWIPASLVRYPEARDKFADMLVQGGYDWDASGLKLVGSIPLPMVWCPPGHFMTGASKRVDDRQYKMNKLVTVERGFGIGKYPVTRAQWLAVVKQNPCRFSRSRWNLDRELTSVDHLLPVNGISWEDAAIFADELTAQSYNDGSLPKVWRYALPTEAQWEYACYAGSSTKFHFGNDKKRLGDYGWYLANSDLHIHQVGQKRPNKWGIYDMYGNVWEWCRDCWDLTELTTKVWDFTIPVTIAGGSTPRIVCGGCYVSEPDACCKPFHAVFGKDHEYALYGLRLVLISEDEQ